jgi:hypothetical protein
MYETLLPPVRRFRAPVTAFLPGALCSGTITGLPVYRQQSREPKVNDVMCHKNENLGIKQPMEVKYVKF